MLVLMGAAVAGCAGDEGTVTVSDGAAERTTSTVPPGSASPEYCDRAEALAADPGQLDLRQDAAGALEGVEGLAAVAPVGLADAFDTFLSGIRSVSDLDQSDAGSLATIFDLMVDPDFEQAADSIETYTASECGVALGATGGAGDGETHAGSGG